MSDIQRIENGKVVRFHYTLRNSENEQLDTSAEAGPLAYLHGAKNIVPGLERHMAGHQTGDRFVAVIAPNEGYGDYQQPGPQPVDRAAFPEDADLRVGVSFTVEAGNGEVFNVWVTAVEEDKVYVDANHPLAGVTLHFDVEIVEIRDASPEEIAHGHPHGPGGHHH